MALSKGMEELLNRQVVHELASEYLYLSMAGYFESQNLRGMAHWMRVQAGEEHGHAMRIFDHIAERGGKISLGAIEKPPAEWKAPSAVFEAAYEHEKKVTALIHSIVEASRAEKDYATDASMQWFVTEQVEEEASTAEIAGKLKTARDSPGALLALDHQLGKRGKG